MNGDVNGRVIQGKLLKSSVRFEGLLLSFLLLLLLLLSLFRYIIIFIIMILVEKMVVMKSIKIRKMMFNTEYDYLDNYDNTDSDYNHNIFKNNIIKTITRPSSAIAIVADNHSISK